MLHRHRVLALLFVLSIITFLDRVCISVAGPRMQSELGITPAMWGWVVGVFAIAYAAFEIPTGAMGDRLGPRRVLTRIVVWWSGFTALTGVVSSYPALLVVRFFFGAGEAGAYPNCSTTIARWFPPGERAQAQGLVWMASRLGGAIAPFVVLPIQAQYGWRASFWIFGAIGLIWAGVWYGWYRDPETPSAPGAARHRVPLKAMIHDKNLWLILLMYHLYCYGGYFYQSWLHTYLVKGRGFSENEMRFYSALPFVLGAIANGVGGFAGDFLVRRVGLFWGRRAIGIFGLSAAAAFTLGAALVDGKIAAAVLLALGLGASDFMLPSAWALCVDVGRDYAGAVSGAMNTAGQVGSFLSSVLFGYAVAAWGNYNLPLIPIAALLLLSALLWLKIDPTRVLSSTTE
ncbi:MAG: MFS transporter [Bryobacterales bacterium]|nr:MFS transporter [Bryobacterales bacterium]